MKRFILSALTIAVGAYLINANAQTAGDATADHMLKTKQDSVSYTAGVQRTEGLLPYITKSLGVDTAYIKEFIEGIKLVNYSGVTPDMKAMHAGMQIGMMVEERMLPMLRQEFKGSIDTLDTELFYKGFFDAIMNDNSVMNLNDAKEYYADKAKQAIESANMANKKAGEDFLAANKKKPGVVTTPSGLQYKVLQKGTGAVPTEDQTVVVKYEGRLINGKVFDTSENSKEKKLSFKANQVIKGWTEALTMMPTGSKWELYIPYNLAYGERQVSKDISPYSTLIFTVELLEIEK